MSTFTSKLKIENCEKVQGCRTLAKYEREASSQVAHTVGVIPVSIAIESG